MIMKRNEKSPGDRPARRRLSDEIREELEQREFASKEDLQAFLHQKQDAHNHAPRPEFQGLSPLQMHRLLTAPFESPEVAVFNPRPAGMDGVPFMRVFRFLSDALLNDNMKATAAGNLPRQFCRDAALDFWGSEKYAELVQHAGVNREEDFWPLSVVRHVAQMAGLIRVYKSRWCLTKPCRALLDEWGLVGVFMPLFQTYAMRFNWSVRSLRMDNDFFQRSFLFSLYLMARYGAEWQPDAFYSNHFRIAFPMLIDEIRQPVIFDPEEDFRRWYSHQVFDEFSWYWRWAETESVYEQCSKQKIRVGCRVKASPLLAEMVTFPK